MKNRRLFLILLLFIITGFFALYFKPLSPDFPLPSFGSKEFFNHTYSDYYFYNQELEKNRFPGWNPYKAGGISTLANPKHSLFNPLTLLVLKTISFPQNLKLLYYLSFLVAGLGAFFYLRKIKLNPLASFLGSNLFVFSGHFIAQTQSLPYFQAIALIPWLFYLTERLIKQSSLKNILFLSLVSGWQILSGPIDLSLITLFFLLVYFLIQTKKRRLKWRPLLLLPPLIFVISSFKLIPLIKLKSLNPYKLSRFYRASLFPKQLLSLVNPTFNTNIPLYIGLTPFLLLVILFVFIKKKRLKFSPLLTFSFASLVFSFLMLIPRYSPLYILYLFPPFNLLIGPGVFAAFLTWNLVIISSLTINKLQTIKKFQHWASFLVLLSLVELTIFNLNNLPTKTAGQTIASLEEKYPFIKTVKNGPGKVWFLASKNANEIQPLEPNNNLLWQIKSLNTNTPTSKRYQTYLDFLYEEITFTGQENGVSLSEKGQTLLNLQEVKYIITQAKIINLKAKHQENELNLYEIPQSDYQLNPDLKAAFSLPLNSAL